MYKDWAMPVVSYPWAVVATVTQWGKKATGYRAFAKVHHRAWERAVGVR